MESGAATAVSGALHPSQSKPPPKLRSKSFGCEAQFTVAAPPRRLYFFPEPHRTGWLCTISRSAAPVSAQPDFRGQNCTLRDAGIIGFTAIPAPFIELSEPLDRSPHAPHAVRNFFRFRQRTLPISQNPQKRGFPAPPTHESRKRDSPAPARPAHETLAEHRSLPHNEQASPHLAGTGATTAPSCAGTLRSHPHSGTARHSASRLRSMASSPSRCPQTQAECPRLSRNSSWNLS